MAVLLAVLAIAAAGCGGSQIAADEVPGAPPALTVPSDGELGGGGADNASSDSGNADEDDTDTDPDAAADDTTGGTATPEATAEPPAADDTTGGTTTPETAPEDTAANDTPPAGSEAEQFESFCEQNAGAC